MTHHVYVVLGCNLGKKSVIITCTHTNTLLLVQRTLFNAFTSISFTVTIYHILKPRADKGAPLVFTLYIHVIDLNKILERISLNEIILYLYTY